MSTSVGSRESLVRTWWSLYSLERTLSIITGRPSVNCDSCCSVPMPMPMAIPEWLSNDAEPIVCHGQDSKAFFSTRSTTELSSDESLDHHRTSTSVNTTGANSGSYFKATVQLATITQRILVSLYSVSTTMRSPEELQQNTHQLAKRLDQWVASLPTVFNYDEPPSMSRQDFVRERMLLGFQLCSARILLGRPSLTNLEQSWTNNHKPSFAGDMANSCIESAKGIIDFLPDNPQLDCWYDKGPWWCIVHHMMQAISILLLGLSHPTVRSHDTVSLMQYIKKALCWLQSMPDPVAQRAYRIAFDLFANVSKRHARDVPGNCSTDVSRSMPTRQEMHRAFSDASASTFASDSHEQATVPSPVSSMHPDMGSCAAYDAWMTGATFAHDEPGQYYTAWNENGQPQYGDMRS